MQTLLLPAGAQIRVNNEIGTTRTTVDPNAVETTIQITRIALADTQEAADALLPKIVVTVTEPTASDNTLYIDAPRPAEAIGNVTDFDASFDEDEIPISLVTTSTRIAQVRLEITVPPGHITTTEQESGSLNIDGPTSPVTFSTTHGTIRVSNATAPVTVDTANGTIRVTGHASSLDAQTDNGTIRVEIVTLAPGEHVTCTSQNGTIRLELPHDINANLMASAGNGTLDFDLSEFDSVSNVSATGSTLTGILNAGGAVIDLQTQNGTIRIDGD